MVLMPSKGYKDLSPNEMAEMIEVHLGGHGRFDADALYEFQCMEYKGVVEDVRKELERIGQEFASSSTHIDGIDPERGRAALEDLARRLREGRFGH
jgi:hypothetical protein